jgi:Kdo2-lipid IVA lauroyltransferase/acyltransferase
MPVDIHAAPKTFRFIDRILYAIKISGIHALRCIVFMLGRRRTLQIGRLLGRVLYAVAGHLRNKILLNLDIAFGTAMTVQHKQRIARDACAHFCANWAELFFAAGPRRCDAMQAITVNGKHHLDRALERGKGVIAVSAHMGVYPLIGTRLSADGCRFLMVVRDLESPSGSAMYDRCREFIRLPSLPTIPEKNFFKTTLSLLRAGGIVCLIADENKRRGGVFVDFFGRSASTAPGPAALARRTGAAIVPMFIVRNPDDTQTIHIHEPIVCLRTGDEESDIRNATAAFTQAIEQQIRQDPAQWPWNNWRWRTQPLGKDPNAKIRKRNTLKRMYKFFQRSRI